VAHRIAQRHRLGTLQHTHDGGVLYAEGAIDALLDGRSPYAVSYADGPLGEKFAFDPYWHGRPHQHILTFQPYLPLPFLAGVPLKGLSALVGLPYDQRLLHLAHLLALLWLLPRMVPRDRGALAQTLVVLNPTFAHYFVQGTNDVLVIFWLLAAIHLIGRRGAAWALAIAAATKQFAWVVLPLAAAAMAPRPAGRGRPELAALVRGAARLWPVALVLALTIGPFLAWTPADFVGDAILFNFGLTDASYPYGGTPGYGLANFVVALGWIDSLEDEFPLMIGTLLVFVPLYLVLLRRLIARPSPRLLAAASGLALFVFLLFGRMFHYNYFAVLAALLTIGWLGRGEEEATHPAAATIDP